MICGNICGTLNFTWEIAQTSLRLAATSLLKHLQIYTRRRLDLLAKVCYNVANLERRYGYERNDS